MAESKVVITFKAGKDYDDPWIVLHGDSVQHAGELLEEVRAKGVFAAVQAAALEFQGQKAEGQAVRALQQAAPGSTVASQTQELPDSLKPRCAQCGAVGVEKTGHSASKNKDYRGVFCSKECGAKPIEFIWTS